MSMRCCIRTCREFSGQRILNGDPNPHNYWYPKDPNVRAKWDLFVNEANRTVNFKGTGHAICARHFRPTCFTKSGRLIPKSVPILADRFTLEVAMKFRVTEELGTRDLNVINDFSKSVVELIEGDHNAAFEFHEVDVKSLVGEEDQDATVEQDKVVERVSPILVYEEDQGAAVKQEEVDGNVLPIVVNEKDQDAAVELHKVDEKVLPSVVKIEVEPACVWENAQQGDYLGGCPGNENSGCYDSITDASAMSQESCELNSPQREILFVDVSRRSPGPACGVTCRASPSQGKQSQTKRPPSPSPLSPPPSKKQRWCCRVEMELTPELFETPRQRLLNVDRVNKKLALFRLHAKAAAQKLALFRRQAKTAAQKIRRMERKIRSLEQIIADRKENNLL